MAGSSDRYARLRHKLIKFFAWRRSDDPETMADETVSRLFKNISAGQEVKSDNPYSYVYAIATNVFREYLRDARKRQALSNDLRPPEYTRADQYSDCRKRCLDNLDQDKYELLIQYYRGEHSRDELARAKGMSLNALRLQIYRIKNELKACHKACVEQVSSLRN